MGVPCIRLVIATAALLAANCADAQLLRRPGFHPGTPAAHPMGDSPINRKPVNTNIVEGILGFKLYEKVEIAQDVPLSTNLNARVVYYELQKPATGLPLGFTNVVLKCTPKTRRVFEIEARGGRTVLDPSPFATCEEKIPEAAATIVNGTCNELRLNPCVNSERMIRFLGGGPVYQELVYDRIALAMLLRSNCDLAKADPGNRLEKNLVGTWNGNIAASNANGMVMCRYHFLSNEAEFRARVTSDNLLNWAKGESQEAFKSEEASPSTSDESPQPRGAFAQLRERRLAQEHAGASAATNAPSSRPGGLLRRPKPAQTDTNRLDEAKIDARIDAFIKDHLGVSFGDPIERFPKRAGRSRIWAREIPVIKPSGYLDTAVGMFEDGRLYQIEFVADFDGRYSVESIDQGVQKTLAEVSAEMELPVNPFGPRRSLGQLLPTKYTLSTSVLGELGPRGCFRRGLQISDKKLFYKIQEDRLQRERAQGAKLPEPGSPELAAEKAAREKAEEARRPRDAVARERER